MSTDYLIVGGGIAGIFLARRLGQRQKSVLIVDSPTAQGSSRAAAWMINPITGMRFSASWRVEEMLPYAQTFYRTLEKESGLLLLHEHEILLFLQNEEEQKRWQKKKGDPLLQRYSQEFQSSGLNKGVEEFFRGINTHGGLMVKGGGRVDLSPWLDQFRVLPPEEVQWLDEEFLPNELSLEADGVRWKNNNFKKVIFCQGYRSLPWFDWLPWKAAKGEILTVRIPDYQRKEIIKKGIFLMPLRDDLFRVGSTYTWEDLNSNPTAEGRDYLTETLKNLIRLPFEVVDHRAGVRPIIHGNKPVLGLHPRYPQIGIFNGLASKGALVAPWLSEHLAQHLEEGMPLNEEVDVARNF